MGRRLVGAGVVGALVVGFGAVQLVPGSSPLAVRPAVAAGLVPYAGCDALLGDVRAELVRTATAWGWSSGEVRSSDVAAASSDQAGGSAREAAPAPAAGPTGTNLQEQGVDEPDVAKLSGDLLVTLTGGALDVVRTGPEPALLGRLGIGGQDGGYGSELLLDGDRALVVVQGWDPGPADGLRLPFGGGDRASTTLRLADLADPAAPRWLEEWAVDGSYVSARLVDGSVRVVTRSTPALVQTSPVEPYGPAEQARALLDNQAVARAVTLEQVLPQARRTVAGELVDEGPAVSCGQVSSAPDAAGGGLLLVTTLRPADGLAPIDATAVTADGDLVYAAADRLVVATSRWGTAGPSGLSAPGPATTQLHAFDTSDPRATRYLASGEVPGRVLGRWALSWHEGALRVATTEGEPWVDLSSSSTLTVLQEAGGRLAPVGRVEGLGRGEQIQAVRYLGDLATVVTFRQTDPLYVLDLADPAAPRLLGELKVPGFSTYLHPVGDDRLLGIGMEADATGRTTGVQASVFDLSDLTRPAQLSRLQLGEGWSEALSESRALSFDPATGLAVLPFAEYLPSEPYQATSALGLLVGADGTLREAGRMAVPPGAWLSRVLLDGDRLYAVTDDEVLAGTTAFAPTGVLPLP